MELKSLKNNMHPLKDLASRRIAIQLWDRPDMYIRAAQWNSVELEYYPNEVTMDNFSSLIDGLPLPESTQTELVSVIKGVYREFTKWFNFHKTFLQLKETDDLLELENPKHMMWTSVGTINYWKTAELLICHRKLDVVHRYKLACLYCFYGDIKNLWGKLPIESQVDFNRAKDLHYFPRNLVSFWTANNELFGNTRQDCKLYLNRCKFAFEFSAMQGLRSATEYFYENLSKEQKRELLVNAAIFVAEKGSSRHFSYISENQQFTDVLCYLLSVMEGHELKKILESHSFDILKCLLHWTRLNIFTELAELAFPYFTEFEFSKLVYFLYKNIIAGYNYLGVVLDLLINRPKNFGNLAVVNLTYLLGYYTQIKDTKSLRLIFKYLDTEERELVVLSANGIINIHYLVKHGEWGGIIPYLREAKLPVEARRKLLKKVWCLKPKLSPKTRKRFTKLVNKTNAVPRPSFKKASIMLKNL